jgi:hypothetical protein
MQKSFKSFEKEKERERERERERGGGEGSTFFEIFHFI